MFGLTKKPYQGKHLTESAALPKREQKRVQSLIQNARGDGKPHSAQDTLPFRQMYRDGVCKLGDGKWSRCIEFEDINYQLAQQDRQTSIFEALCDMYNAHDASIGLQMCLINRKMKREEFLQRIEIAAQQDGQDYIRDLYSSMLQAQLEKGTNGVVKTKFFVLTVEAANLKAARVKLQQVVLGLLGHLKAMGSMAVALSGMDWLELLHGIMHPDGEPFRFDWDVLPITGLHVKDCISPSSFRFANARQFEMGTKVGAASFLQITAPEMADDFLSRLLDTESNMLVSVHIRSMNQTEAIKTVKRKITDIDSMKIDAQKRAVREGFDIDIIPTDIATYAGEAQKILRDLQTRNERMFLVTFLVVNIADSKQELENDLLRGESVAQEFNCQLTRLDFQQEQGFVSALPLGVNQIKIERGLTTSAVSIFVPFVTQELFQGGDALYMGLNAISGNMIMADRKQLNTPNGLILGQPGSGKSFAAKRCILNAFLITGDDILILDPEREYQDLVQQLGGQVIKISPGSKQYINPMDISLSYSDDGDPLPLKTDFILSFCELITGRNSRLEGEEKSIINRAVQEVYRPFMADPKPENIPILEDLYEAINAQPYPEARRLANALELYVHGSLDFFNHRTNVDISNRLVCFDLKEIGRQLKNFGMLVIQDQIWNRVSHNRELGKATWYFADEFHLLLKGESASWSVEIWKRFRKWGGVPTGITQNVKDLLQSDEVENILENSDFIYLLSQGPGDRDILCQRLNISNKQAQYITNMPPGEGLMKFGNVMIPFKDHFPKDNPLYQLMTTKPDEVNQYNNLSTSTN